MSGSVRPVSPSPHSATAAAAHAGAGAAASAVGSAPPANAIAISQRSAASTTPISDMFPGLAGNPTYVAGESEIPFYENLRAQHASPLEHMPEFHDKILGYLTHATDAILVNNSAHATKIEALRAELDSFQAAETLNLPHVLYLSFKIAALCSDFDNESCAPQPLSVYRSPYVFFKKYACNNELFPTFSYPAYARGYAIESQLDHSTLWPVPFFDENAEHGFATEISLLSKGCFPIGFPTKNDTRRGHSRTNPLGAAGHNWTPWEAGQETEKAEEKSNRIISLAKLIYNKCAQLRRTPDLQKKYMILTSLMPEENLDNPYAARLFDQNQRVIPANIETWVSNKEKGLQSTIFILALTQPFADFKEIYQDLLEPGRDIDDIVSVLVGRKEGLARLMNPAIVQFTNWLRQICRY